MGFFVFALRRLNFGLDFMKSSLSRKLALVGMALLLVANFMLYNLTDQDSVTTVDNNSTNITVYFVEASKAFNFTDVNWCSIESAALHFPLSRVEVLAFFHQVRNFLWCNLFLWPIKRPSTTTAYCVCYNDTIKLGSIVNISKFKRVYVKCT